MADSSHSTPEVDSLTQKIAAVSLQSPSQEQANLAKQTFINAKINPADPKEKIRLEKMLAPTYTERQTETPPSREQKLDEYIKELERQFDELEQLQAEEKEILEAHSQKHYIPRTRPIDSIYGMFTLESNEAKLLREKEFNELRRIRKMNETRSTVLHEALRLKIREYPDRIPEGLEKLNKEEMAQEILAPLYKKRVEDRKQDLATVKKLREENRYYAKPPVAPKRDITNDAPELNGLIGMHYRSQLLKNALSHRPLETIPDAKEVEKRRALIEKNLALSDRWSKDNKDVMNGRILDGRAKKYKPLV
jgi:hypothetical protein